MNHPHYDWHSSILATPSLIGAFLLGLALGSEWLGVLLTVIATILFAIPYQLYFSTAEGHPRRRHIGTNAVFISAQIILWGIAFALLHAFKHVSAM